MTGRHARGVRSFTTDARGVPVYRECSSEWHAGLPPSTGANAEAIRLAILREDSTGLIASLHGSPRLPGRVEILLTEAVLRPTTAEDLKATCAHYLEHGTTRASLDALAGGIEPAWEAGHRLFALHAAITLLKRGFPESFKTTMARIERQREARLLALEAGVGRAVPAMFWPRDLLSVALRKPRTRFLAARVLLPIGDRAALLACRAALGGRFRLREAAICALSESAHPTSVALLRKAVRREPSLYLRLIALDALEARSPRNALTQAIREAATEKNPGIRLLAARVARTAEDASTREKVRTWQQAEPDDTVRERLMSSIASWKRRQGSATSLRLSPPRPRAGGRV